VQVRTPRDIGALIRSHRRAAHLSQSRLASQVGVSQRWVSEMENGKPSAEIGLVLRALTVLDIALDAIQPRSNRGLAQAIQHSDIHIDDIVDEAARPRESKS